MKEQEVQETLRFKTSSIPHTAIYLMLPLEGVGVLVLITYIVFHFHAFVDSSTAIVSWMLAFAGISLYTLLGVFIVRLTKSGIETLLALGKGLTEIALNIGNGIADIRRKEAEIARLKAGTMLLHTDSGYVVYKENGRIIVAPIAQPRLATTQVTQEVIDSEIPQQLNPSFKTFRQLIEEGTVQKALQCGKMVFGYRLDGTLRMGTWLDLYSVGVGGLSGTGKSTTVRNFLFQSILGNGKFIMIDYHIADKEESLAAQFEMFPDIHFLPPCEGKPKELQLRIKAINGEYTYRRTNGIKGPPVIFILDEFNELVRMLPDEIKKELADLLLTIAQGGRKFGIFAMIIAQRWAQQDLGGYPYGAAIRSSLSSILAHRLRDEGQAKALVGSREGPKVLRLVTGHYMFADTHGDIEDILTPANSWKDAMLVKQLLDSWVVGLLPESIDYAGRETSNESTTKTQESTEPLYTENALMPEKYNESRSESGLESTENREIHALALQVISLQSEGKNKTDIMRQLWNVTPGDSQIYNEAKEQYKQVMGYIASLLSNC